ncbi:MAG: HEAT repeat domain-containing protein [Candidatus Hodarchaeales archaeon]
MDSKDLHLKDLTAAALGKIADKKAVNVLMKSFYNENSRNYVFVDVRLIILESLGFIGDNRAVNMLIEILEAKDVYEHEIRIKAATALGKIGDLRAVYPLIKTLKDETSSLRVAAAWSLGMLGDTRAITPLIELSREKTSVMNSIEASTISLIKLGQDGKESLVDALVNEISKKRNRGRSIEETIALLDLIQCSSSREMLVRKLKDNDPLIRLLAVDLLAIIGDQESTTSLRMVLRDQNSLVRARAATTLGSLKDAESLNHLVKSLTDHNDIVRIAATEALMEISDKRAIRQLISFFNKVMFGYSSTELLSFSVISALVNFGIQDTDYYLQYLESDDFASILSAFIMSLLGDKRAIKPLIEVLGEKYHNDHYVNLFSIEALGLLRDPSAIDPIIPMLKSRTPAVRIASIRALERLKANQAVRQIKKCLIDGDRDVIQNAAEVLKSFDWEPGNDEERIFSMLEAEKWDEIFQKGHAAVLPLCQALLSVDSFYHEKIIQTLGNLKDERAVESMIKFLKDVKYDNIINEVAVAMIKIGDSSIDPLIHALGDDRVNEAVSRILKRFGKHRVLTPLLANITRRTSEEDGVFLLNSLSMLYHLKPPIRQIRDLKPLLLSIILGVSNNELIEKAKQMLINLEQEKN